MTIIPVLDILNGVVVRGVGGDRENYRPIKSLLTESCDPSMILNTIRQQFGLRSFYVADLDAIQNRSLNRCTIAELCRSDVSLMVDAGVRSSSDVVELLDLGVGEIVVGLETLPDEHTAQRILAACPADQTVLSLDFKNGVPLTNQTDWQHMDAETLAMHFAAMGFHNQILLDLAAVGNEGGVSTLELCRKLKHQLPQLNLITGGGVADVTDVAAAARASADGLLIASALHNGRITPDDLNSFSSTRSVK